MLSSSASNEFESLQQKHLSFTPTPGAHLATTTAPNKTRKVLWTTSDRKWRKIFVLKVQVASAKEELEKLNIESRHFQSLSDIRARLCNNCHCSGHTKVKCSKPPCTDISVCKIIEKHPEHKTKISQLQREIRSLENKAQEEETHLKVSRPHVSQQNLRISLL